MTRPEPGFEAVLARASSGDADAFAELVRPLLPRLAGYLAALARDAGEDLVNECLLRVHRGLPRFAGDADAFRAWVFTIAHHLVIDHRRRKGRRPDAAALVHDLPAPIAHSTESLAMAQIGSEEVERVLALLRPAHRQVLLLRIVADLSIEQTAAVMDKSPGAVKVLQHRALGAARKLIRPEEP